MKGLSFLLATDYGLFSLIGLIFMIFGMGGFFIYLFLFKTDSKEAQSMPKSKPRLPD